MAITKPPVLPAWADAGDKVQPSNAELSVGWPVSSTPPSRQRFNWALNFVANAVRYFSRRGLVDYDVAETYMIGDRVIGDDGKTYKCLVDNTIAFTPSTNPAKWARWGFTLAELNSEVTTPTQFDNTTKVATTAFVQANGLRYATGAGVYANRNLTVADIGTMCLFRGAFTVTMPTPTSLGLPLGASVTFYASSIAGTVAVGAGATFDCIGSPVSVKGGEAITFVVSAPTQWLQFGSADLGKIASFGSSLSGIGYQKLPGGLIIQWGQLAPSSLVAGGESTITLPIAFTSGTYAIIATNGSSVGGGGVSPASSYGAISLSLSQFLLQNQTTASKSEYVWWFAIGK